jgi:hypothetical protein
LKQSSAKEIFMQDRFRALLILTLAFLALPGLASADLAFRGWGIRAGMGDDPDQGIVGAHWDLGTLTTNLRFVPNFELGFGDNQTIAGLTLPLHYVFPVGGSFVPYAGGGAVLAYVDRDKKDSEFEVAVALAFGVDMILKSHNKLFIELDVQSGDVHDVKLIFGWSWMRR